MKRLIEKGLMFGNLVHIASPTLVDRYNRALEHLIGKQTNLTDFHVDISGYSPEIGDEMNDRLYLNHNGVNRQFILLTTEQKSSPLLNAQFSTNRSILRDFITKNDAQLFALTATDAVAGELVNSVFSVLDPARLFDIRKIRIEADTTSGTLRHAVELTKLVGQFKSEEDAWFDDVLIAEMITVAYKSGDITRNPVKLNLTEFEQRNFWTAHFGGLYVFQDLDHPAVIAVQGKDGLTDLPIDDVFDFRQRNRIAKFLEDNDLVEPIVKARGVDAAAILQQKMDFVVIDTAANLGIDLDGLSRTDMRRLARQNREKLPEVFGALNALASWARGGGSWPRISSDHPAYFYTLRATDTKDRDLVNMMLAELTPLDIRQLFICHKELFYSLYATWPDVKKAYVVDFLDREYQVDKVGAREALYGHEPDMAGETPPLLDDLVQRVGPWGAFRRR
ncbi:MAG: hypothetical protein JKY94_03180 [Rhodobacteraceae bacterium]|nr:hypothetical protein [Paracoccaceae bacterium]